MVLILFLRLCDFINQLGVIPYLLNNNDPGIFTKLTMMMIKDGE